MKLYGIKTCDQVRKAWGLLEKIEEDYQYIDLRENPLSETLLQQWLDHFGNNLINKKSTTYREKKAEIEAAKQPDEILQILQKYPLLIKRPILETKTKLFHGKEVIEYLTHYS